MNEGSPKFRRALIVSGAFNVLFVSLFFYWLTNEPAQKMLPTQKHASLPQQFEKLLEMKERSFDELVQLLKDETRIDGTYLGREFALASLVTYHDFDIERALGIKPFSRTLAIPGHPELASLKFYPGLTDTQYQQLFTFARGEPAPITFHGLFTRLKKDASNASLRSALVATSEYQLLKKALFGTPRFEREEAIISLMLEGDEALIGSLMHYEGITKEVILQRYLAYGSATAALVAAPPVKAALEAPSQEVKPKQTPRPKVQIAQRKEPQRPSTETKNERFHLIVQGDTLWKISRKYQCDIDKIRKLNHLKSDALKPGKLLKIPS